jgi:hypothetical protein
MTTPFVTTREDTDEADDQEIGDKDLVTPKTAHRMPRGAEESLVMNYQAANT